MVLIETVTQHLYGELPFLQVICLDDLTSFWCTFDFDLRAGSCCRIETYYTDSVFVTVPTLYIADRRLTALSANALWRSSSLRPLHGAPGTLLERFDHGYVVIGSKREGATNLME